MPRILHGQSISLSTLEVADDVRGVQRAIIDPLAFDFMFPTLQGDAANLLPDGASNVENLKLLGRAMRDPGDSASDPGKSAIPAVFTYLGQFIDHDITLEALSAPLPELLKPDLEPLAERAIRATIRNLRTATLDLDSVYGAPAQRAGDNLVVGKVSTVEADGTPIGNRPLNKDGSPKDDDHDLPREPRSVILSHDRAALIGDPRNDENLIVAQLHLAFLRAHNAIVAQGNTFEQAQTLLRQHYQHIVLTEFLPAVADPVIVSGILQNGNQFFNPPDDRFFMPLEFSFAAYRFGHTMVRKNYDFNVNFGPQGTITDASLSLLFTFTALGGEIGFGVGTDTLPENWIIDWTRFVEIAETATNFARRLDTKLVEPLFELQDLDGTPGADDANPVSDGARLAVRNLLRGYLLRLPTGQAVATALGQVPLTPDEIRIAAASDAQGAILDLNERSLLQRTPLWYYILAEANHGANAGKHLGVVGSTIVAEVLIGLIRRSQDSILAQSGWTPTLGNPNPGVFSLADLMRLAKVL